MTAKYKPETCILIVDDDVLITESTKSLLQLSGYTSVYTASDAGQAIETVKEINPGLILMDINLHDSVDGITAAEEIQKFSDIPFIFLTAYSDDDTIERVKRLRPLGYLIKPFENRELLVTIETSLYRHSLDKMIKEQELLFRTVANFAYEWEFWLLPDHSFKYCSPSCKRVSGYTAEEFISNPGLIYHIVHPEDKSTFSAHMHDHYDKHNPNVTADFQFRIIDKGGEVKYIGHNCMPIYDEDGKFLGRRGTNQDITEKKLAEIKLKENEEKFRALFEQAGDYAMVLEPTEDYDLRIIEANKTASEIHGLSKDEFIGMLITELDPTFNKTAFEEKIKSSMLGEVIHFETEHIRKDGSMFPVEVTARAVLLPGKPAIIYSIERDISDRKRAEKELKESEELNRLITENSLDAILLTKPDGRIFSANPAARAMFQMTDEELYGIERNGLVELNDPRLHSLLSERQNNGKVHGELLMVRKDGSKFEAELSSSTFIDKNGEKRTSMTVRDITERKRMEKILEESEKRFRLLFENAPLSYQSLDINGCLIDVNPEWLRTMGYKYDEVVGRHFTEFMTRESAELVKTRFADFKRKGEIHNYEFEMIKKDGTHFIVSYEGRIGYDELGNFKQTHCIFIDITVQKNVESALRDSEERYRNLVEYSPIPVVVISYENGYFLYANKKAYELMGKPPEGKSPKEYFVKDYYVNPKDREILRGQIEEKGYATGFEMELKTLIGTTVTVLVSAIVTYFGDEKAIFTSFHDISERKLAEKAVKESENKFNKLFNSNPAMMIVSRITDRKITDINDSFIRTLGYKREEVIGKTADELRLFSKSEMQSSLKKKLNGSDTLTHAELDIRKKNGEIISGLFFGEKIESRGEDYFFTIMIDITERNLLTEKVNKLSSAVEQSPVSIIITDISGKIEYTNQTFKEITGYSINEAVGQNPRILKSGEQNEEFYANLWNTILSGKNWSGLFHNKKKNGELFWESAIISPIKNDAGKITHFVAIKEDITEKVKQENELIRYREHLEELVEKRTEELDKLNLDLTQQLQKQIELEMLLRESLSKEKELNELKTRFISTASHEFKTPLTSVLSSAELLQRYGRSWSAEKNNEHMERIKRAVEHINNLLDEVLTISRVESRKINFEPEKTDLKEFCNEIVSEIKFVSDKNRKFIFNYGPDEKYYSVDRKLMKLIIGNLLSNAFKYSKEEGTVELNITSADGRLLLEIIDEGIGIPEKDMKHLFEPFYRCTNSGAVPGSGLGLSIVKQSVELHHGEIYVRSKISKGTKFTVKL